MTVATRTIDLNADVGESFGPWPMGADAGLIPLVSSVNIACGAHAGDPVTLLRTVELAGRHGVAIGAHPGYPDLVGFGRRDLDLTDDELRATIVTQVGAVLAAARVADSRVRHVKPHGAMYNRAARDEAVAAVIARAIRDVDENLVLVALAGSVAAVAGRAAGLRVAEEAFADRRYEPDGSLRSRRLEGAILAAAEAADQSISIVRDGFAVASDGSRIAIHADTLCVHGDTPGAIEIARAVRSGLHAAGIAIAAFNPA